MQRRRLKKERDYERQVAKLVDSKHRAEETIAAAEFALPRITDFNEFCEQRETPYGRLWAFKLPGRHGAPGIIIFFQFTKDEIHLYDLVFAIGPDSATKQR